ncbi:exodeoxyribonuclease V subunit RecB [Vibrio chagasii]|nr:exodeoxyribonuclease V subunit RecB [Vibrio chagasii]
MQPKELNALSVDLLGSKLIEASAGTGKTYTIATLYLRLLLGHGATINSVHSTPLSVEQILVVTFTEAATEELRDRIRRRIREARIAFMRDHTNDPTISEILKATNDKKAAINILLRAERQMDESSIYTIHGFCQRMLTQNAFEAGTLFNSEFMPDESKVRMEVVTDFWRKYFYSLSKGLCAEIQSFWKTPSDLLRELSPFLSGTMVNVNSNVTIDDNLELVHLSNLDQFNSLKNTVRNTSSDEIHSILRNSGLCKRSYTKKMVDKSIESLWSWAQNEAFDYSLPENIERFSNDLLLEKTKKGDVVSHPLFDSVSDLLKSKPSIKDSAFLLAIDKCREALAESKLNEAWMSFDDLLSNLSRALNEDESNVLAHRIRTQYPFAMIDEFQDTDPMQYNIFSKIYQDKKMPEDAEEVKTGLFLIGDPKQAIYAFRGADVFTYMTAKRSIDELLTLSRNWRSSHEVVESVNTLFSLSDSPFIYDKDIPYTPAVANSKVGTRQWMHNGVSQSALTIWHQESLETVTKGDYQTRMSEATASKIQEILTSQQKGDSYLLDKGIKKEFLASDIAVLVRTGREAELIQRSLSAQGIASVYLSGKASVYGSSAAKDVYRLMTAVLDPKNERAVRGVLTSNLFNLTAKDIEELNQSDKAWDEMVVEFMAYQNTWTFAGILPMIRQVLTNRGIASKLLAQTGGERAITNILHIGELLQQASQTIDSLHGLLKHLDENIKEPNGNAEEQQLKLESEQNLVQIVTIHKSKGLEYDFVFMPFICGLRELDTVLFHEPDQESPTLDLTGCDESRARAEEEKIAEDLRLLYVGLTRSVYATFLGVAAIRNGRTKKEPTGLHKTAIGHLIQNGKEMGVADLTERLNELSGKDFITIKTPPERHEYPMESCEAIHQQVTPNEFTASVESDWWITSYSHLASHTSHSSGASFDTASVDPSMFESSELENVNSLEDTIYTFERGATAGTFLHAIFEEVEYTESAYSPKNTSEISHLMRMNGVEDKWLPILQKLVDDVTSCDLNGSNLRLNKVHPKDRLVEMEFLIPISYFKAEKLNEVMRKHDPLSADFHLDFKDVSGLLKGFIDLTFSSDGKFYVLDWKSNYLGDTPAYYHQNALKDAMTSHRYDLQCVLYVVALHKFLKAKLPDYSYDEHVGGALYIFLRGIKDGTDNGIYFRKPSYEMITELENVMYAE